MVCIEIFFPKSNTMANKKQGRAVNVCVVGLSGYDIHEKRLYGVGKSCFCNRFVRPKEDDYLPEQHTSMFSTSEFFGGVLNNDHFLYWGSTEKCYDDTSTTTFKVIEQTEFLDDVTYLPITKDGRLQNYPKRATATKLTSSAKLMYICRDQVALQSDYEQVPMDRDGKIHIDGFICIYDVSTNLADHVNNAEIQERTLSALLINIQKSKTPVIVVATKCDLSSNETLQKAHQFVNSKKLPTPLVECSAAMHVNIDLGFQALSQLVDTKIRTRAKLISFQEGFQQRSELLKLTNSNYISLVENSIKTSEMRLTWNDFESLYEDNKDVLKYKEICGSDNAKLIFKQQTKKVKRYYEDRKLNEYLKMLPNALDELLPSLQSIECNEWKWENCQQAIKNHIFFEKWFEILPKDTSWNKSERLVASSGENDKIPFDVLQVERSRACYDRHIKKLSESARKVRMKGEFKRLLELTDRILPGTSWSTASTWILGEESYKYLDETERKTIFETYLREITLQAKLDFQELLFESARKLYKFSELVKDSTPTPEELAEVNHYLENDERYRNIENVGNARDILLFNHIALMQHPNRCLSGPEKCMDRLMQQVVELTSRRTTHNHYENEIFRENEDELINILVLGKDGLAKELEDKIKIESSSYECLEYIIDGQIYDLNFKVYVPTEDEEDAVQNLPQIIEEFKPQGYLAIYSTLDSLKYLENCWEKAVKDGQKALPLILLLAKDPDVQDEDVSELRTEGQKLAEKTGSMFVDYPYSVSLMDDPIHYSQVQDAVRGIVDVINKRARPPCVMPANNEPADVRIMLCAMCGDEFPVELILGTMLQHHTSYSNPEQQDTVMLEAALGGTRKIISVTLGSYHRAYSLKSQLFHGYILVYSATRMASLETLRAFASIIPKNIPVQVLEVTGAACSASIVFHEESSSFLSDVNDDLTIPSKLSLMRPCIHNQAGAFLNFFNNVHDKCAENELLQTSIKPRRHDPLPAVPHTPTTDPNDEEYEGAYAVIREGEMPAPYIGTAIRTSAFHLESDSNPSSPDLPKRTRSRSYTSAFNRRDTLLDTSEEVILHDETGLYAKVNKKSKDMSIDKSSEDEDDDVIWQTNVAYDTTISITTPDSLNNSVTRISDRPYATVPSMRKADKESSQDNDKFNTFPANLKPLGWNEPTYASIDQLKNDGNRNLGYEPGSTSSVSTRSKESQGSLLELCEPTKTSVRHSDISPRWQDEPHNWHRPMSESKSAPLATPDGDENDLRELRGKLEDVLALDSSQSLTDIKDNKRERKSRTGSNRSSHSLDPKSPGGIFRTIMRRVSPAPSPGNSDLEHEGSDSVVQTPLASKKKIRKSFRQRKQSPGPLKVEVNAEHDEGKLRASTMSDPNLRTSGDSKKQHKSIFNKKPHETPTLPLSDTKDYQTQTLDRKKHKKIKLDLKLKSKDDTFIIDSVSTQPQEKKKEKRFRVSRSSRPKPNKMNKNMQQKLDEWNKTQSSAKNTNSYFGRPLKDILTPGTKCPVFVEKVIKYVECNGLQSEGIYRVSGNRHAIEAVVQKFDANNTVNLQELGVAVHAVTGSLKHFFKQLPQPLIPHDFGGRIKEIMIIMDAAERLGKIRELCYELPDPNLEIFARFMCHLNRVTEYKLTNKMDARNLQIVLYPTLMQASFEPANMAMNMTKTMNEGLFIQTCIEQSKLIFDEFYKEETAEPKDVTDLAYTNNFMDSTKNETNDEADTGYSHDELDDNFVASDEPSLMESVLSDPGMDSLIKTTSEDLLSSPGKLSPGKKTRRKSYETLIY